MEIENSLLPSVVWLSKPTVLYSFIILAPSISTFYDKVALTKFTLNTSEWNKSFSSVNFSGHLFFKCSMHWVISRSKPMSKSLSASSIMMDYRREKLMF